MVNLILFDGYRWSFGLQSMLRFTREGEKMNGKAMFSNTRMLEIQLGAYLLQGEQDVIGKQQQQQQ